MKISKNQLRQIIREAVSAMAEQSAYGDDLKVNKIKSTLTRSDTQGGGSRATSNLEDVGADSTLTRRSAQDTGTGKTSVDTKSVRSDGSTSSQEERYVGDTSYGANTRVPAGGSRAAISRTNPLGLGSAEGAMDTSTLKKGGTELNIGDEGYMDAFADVGMPGLPETGETEEEGRFVKSADVSALDETFKRWKKLI